jgi:hypothetical protein
MAVVLDFVWVKQFVCETLSDPEPRAQCVRIYRSVTSIVVSAALLNTTSVEALSRFTSINASLIRAIAWNLRNSKLWTTSTYDYSEWLSMEGELNQEMLL